MTEVHTKAVSDTFNPEGGVEYMEREVMALIFMDDMEMCSVDVPLGGGKGAIYVNPKTEKLSEGELERLTRGFAFKISEIIGPEKDICTRCLHNRKRNDTNHGYI